MMPDHAPTHPPPSSILIVGAGVFGLSTIQTLLLSPRYSTTSLHLLDPYLPPLPPPSPISANTTDPSTHPPNPPDPTLPPPQNPHASSIDTSRIIRADYAHPAYSRLAAEAQQHWRRGFGRPSTPKRGRRDAAPEQDHSDVYKECGLVVSATGEGHAYIDKARLNAEGLGQKVEGIPAGGEERVRAVATGLPSLLLAAVGKGDVEEEGGGQSVDDGGGGNGEEGEEKGEGNGVGAVGYVNHVSGVANAGKAMEAVMEEVVRLCVARNERVASKGGGLGNVTFHRTGVSSLLTSPASSPHDERIHLLGVIPTSGAPIHADLVILATGAWTPSLLDLRGRAKATAQVIAYLPLNEDEAAMLKDMKVLLNLGTGMFAIPPIRNAEGVWELKLARHGYGYENAVGVELDVGFVEPGLSSKQGGGRKGGKVMVEQSLPSPFFAPIPMEAELACRGFLKQIFPPSSSPLRHLPDRPFASTRLCWYTDTPKADFLVDFHPRFRSPVRGEREGGRLPRNLLVATGGSGHAFKFLPVMGEKIVARLEGHLEPELAGLWEWKRDRVEDDWGEVDGSRGGVKGMKLEEEWAKGRKRESKL